MSYLFYDNSRDNTYGDYDTDISNIRAGETFPSNEVLSRNKIYRFNRNLYTGKYAEGKNLVAIINDVYTNINYKILPLNYFKLIVNKLDSLVFGNDIIITTPNPEIDIVVNKLIERTNWLNKIRQGFRMAQIYGDCIIKTHKNGVSVIEPVYGYKVVKRGDKSITMLTVLSEILYDDKDTPEYIRLLICGCGFEFERVYRYNGNNISGTLGEPVRYKYDTRWIPKSGRYYYSGIDVNTVQWMSVNMDIDGVYGTSSFKDIKDIVFALENRLSTENWVIDAHGKPLLIAGMSAFKTDELTGEYKLSVIDGKYMVDRGGNEKPEYLTWDGKLEASKQVRDDLLNSFYELSEMGKTFLSGEYSGNISEESLNNIIKSAIDRGNRDANDIWYTMRDSLYVLCRLNDIDIEIEDINIKFNIGRADDNKVLAETCKILSEQGLFSKQTLLTKFWGYNIDDANVEINKVKEENSNDNT